MASTENTEVRIISFFIVCVVGFGKKVVLRSIHHTELAKLYSKKVISLMLCRTYLWGEKLDPPGLSS